MFKSVVAVAACCLALSACGGGGSDEDQARAAANDFVHAFAEGDMDKACELMTGNAKRQIVSAGAALGGGDCPKIMKAARGLMDKGELQDVRNYKIKSVTVKGDTAVIKDNSSDGEPTRMRKVSGDWLVDGDISG
jgi:hypothetical protein